MAEVCLVSPQAITHEFAHGQNTAAPDGLVGDGYAELENIYRQKQQWMRDASLDFARGNVGEAITGYTDQGRIFGSPLRADAVTNLIDDWNRDYDPSKSTLILAHLRQGVRALNDLARGKLIERELIEPGRLADAASHQTPSARERSAAGVICEPLRSLKPARFL